MMNAQTLLRKVENGEPVEEHRCPQHHCGRWVKRLYKVPGFGLMCRICLERLDAMLREDARQAHYDRFHIGL
jgi:hypothetical protein